LDIILTGKLYPHRGPGQGEGNPVVFAGVELPEDGLWVGVDGDAPANFLLVSDDGEVDMAVFPEEVRETFSQMMTISEKAEIPKHYKTDLWVHDRMLLYNVWTELGVIPEMVWVPRLAGTQLCVINTQTAMIVAYYVKRVVASASSDGPWGRSATYIIRDGVQYRSPRELLHDVLSIVARENSGTIPGMSGIYVGITEDAKLYKWKYRSAIITYSFGDVLSYLEAIQR
jgi:hypothetical protein